MGHLDPTQNSQAASEKKLRAYACELEQKLEARTRELAEALERQSATSEVLQVISSSPGELEPVFQAMLEKATRLCEANCGNLLLLEGNSYRVVARHGAPAAYAELRQREPVVIDIRDHPYIPIVRIIATKDTLHIHDLTADRSYIERDPRIVTLGRADSFGAARAANARGQPIRSCTVRSWRRRIRLCGRFPVSANN